MIHRRVRLNPICRERSVAKIWPALITTPFLKSESSHVTRILSALVDSTVLFRFCWGGGHPGRFADLGANHFATNGSGLDKHTSSSDSDIPKFYIDHLETYTGNVHSPPPADRATTPKARFSGGRGQEKEKGESFFKAVSRSLQSSPVQSPMPTPGGRTAIAS